MFISSVVAPKDVESKQVSVYFILLLLSLKGAASVTYSESEGASLCSSSSCGITTQLAAVKKHRGPADFIFLKLTSLFGNCLCL